MKTVCARPFVRRGISLALGIALMPAAWGQATPDPDNSTLRYPAAYFAEFEPVSVNDMLNQIPGISLALDANSGGSSTSLNANNRGLGASSQILIDGKRLAGKANEASEQLSRIAAAQVDYIEIIRGTSSELDVRNSGQIVNIVLVKGASRSSLAAEMGVNHFHDGSFKPDALLAYSGQSGALDYRLSAAMKSGFEVMESRELSLHPDLRFNDAIAYERIRDETDFTLNANLAYQASPADRIALNMLYNEADPPADLLRATTDFNRSPAIIRYEREDLPSTLDNWELGGDYEHGFAGGGRYKALFIVNEKNEHTTRERYLSATLGGVESKNLYLDTRSRYRERIVRTSYTWNLAEGQGMEVGVERAQTIQDSALKRGLALPGTPSPDYGGLVPVPQPNAVSTVEEIRYEVFGVHNWQINSRLSLESSLITEFSEISQTGDVQNTRDFRFLKPKFDLRYDISRSFQFRASIDKFVSQLSFADFSANVNNRDDDQDTVAGNPELEQEQWWRYTFNLDYRLPNDGGALNSRVFYYEIDNAIGKIDISPSASRLVSTNGNVGDGKVYGVNLDASIRLGMIGLPGGLLTAGVLLQDSLIDDPLIGMERRIVPFDRGNVRLGFRYDIPAWSLNYGFNYRDGIDGNRPFWDIDNVLFLGSNSYLNVFAEKVGFGGLSYRLELNNLLNHESCRERRRFNGYLRDGDVREIERSCTEVGTQLAFRVRGTF
ncbi:MAG: TonB-dependent receptor plug domain-containing protein [Pseudomonadales bacterium]|nr:TonB-dependent receptor plug domain-containing protein [Pseudomonadales bacterium]MCP5330658.1 TonB-dependent receptor plug domain-containing protein [Pseudomonadales bacterium]MCP5344284.1 TonB-dependent receptor plug domain-containing protein [Pseudomonadales bacterium]